MPLPDRRALLGWRNRKWHEDPEILRKIDQVVKLRSARMSLTEIAEALGTTRQTVAKYLEWGMLLWQQSVVLDQHLLQAEAVAAHDTLLQELWKHLLALGQYPGRQANYAAALASQIRQTEWQRDQLLGVVKFAQAQANEEATDEEVISQLERVASRLGLRVIAEGAIRAAVAARANALESGQEATFEESGDSGVDLPEDEGPLVPDVLSQDVPGGGDDPPALPPPGDARRGA